MFQARAQLCVLGTLHTLDEQENEKNNQTLEGKTPQFSREHERRGLHEKTEEIHHKEKILFVMRKNSETRFLTQLPALCGIPLRLLSSARFMKLFLECLAALWQRRWLEITQVQTKQFDRDSEHLLLV
jgi:hypothetical protein